MKLWDKGIEIDDSIERFTIGRDPEFDLYLASYDVVGSIAHARMLQKIGILKEEEGNQLIKGLKKILQKINDGKFQIDAGVEDVHSQVEMMLTKQLGGIGKKVHSGRSRNDQVLLDLRLFFREEIRQLTQFSVVLGNTLLLQSENFKDFLLPGYTHFQVAMPSSFGLWFGAYAESLADDLILLHSAYEIINQNPLGSAAGYGTSFPLDRKYTTELLGFKNLNYNVVYAQMGRGKTERVLAYAMAALAATISKMAYDVTLFNSQNFGFMKLPDQFTTGSSIMPHKKNPDVFELIRAKCNRIQALPNDIAMATNNLPSGYHRDYQVLKELIFPALFDLKDCLVIAEHVLKTVEVNDHWLNDPRYQFLFSVEAVNKKVLAGMSFRDAYQEIGKEIEAGEYKDDPNIKHTHEGSIGNLCNKEIKLKFDDVTARFDFEAYLVALNNLIEKA
mgnify:CR=1 FL=1